MIKGRYFLALCALLLVVGSPLSADAKWYMPQEWGVAGFGNIDLDMDSGDLVMAGATGSVGKALWHGEQMQLDLRLEASAATIWHKARGMEFALVPGLRFYLDRERMRPYIEAGVGPSYNTMYLKNVQGMGFNFLSYGGLGLRIMMWDRCFVDVGTRVRHISNAGLSEVNYGITSFQTMVGFGMEF